ncbi:hypothetical protein ACPA9J_35535 [Pseudomonas aeruginosa]
MRVYDGETLKDTDPKAKSIQEYRDSAGVDVAHGRAFHPLRLQDPLRYSTRPARGKRPTRCTCSTSSKQIERNSSSRKPASATSGASSRIPAAPRYVEFIGKEIQTCLPESYSEYGQNIFDRPCAVRRLLDPGPGIRDPETGEILNRAALNEELRRSRNSSRHQRNPKDFRNEIVNFMPAPAPATTVKNRAGCPPRSCA